MCLDVIELNDFYNSRLGRVVADELSKLVATQFQNLHQEFSAIVGYGLPFVNNPDKMISLMPAQQGVVAWPSKDTIKSCLVDECSLPLPDRCLDSIIMVHVLEHTYHNVQLLREVWRVLKGDGRLLVIVPNRRGLWARADHTPFGYGQPYTMTQLSKLLESNLFTPIHYSRGLYGFPSQNPFLLSMKPFLKKIGETCLQKFSGIVAIEAVKQVYAGIPISKIKKRELAWVPLTDGVRG